MAATAQSKASHNNGSPAAAAQEFSVSIVASGPTLDGSLVHAVSVIQPTQSWTVLRSQNDFTSVGTALQFDKPCPAPPPKRQDLDSILASRNELQEWLSALLHMPEARTSPAVQSFLTYGANMIPPQFERVAWVNFTVEQQQQQQQQQNIPSSNATTAAPTTTTATSPHHAHHHHHHTNLDDMEMDDMFAGDSEDEDDESLSEEEEIVQPKQYKPMQEAITQEDEMEILQAAENVEMIQDVGSLAQSLGASHLGRSLQLQAQQQMRATQQKTTTTAQAQQQGGGGVVVKGAASSTTTTTASGGIGHGLHQGLGDSFHQKPPQSAPGLDSFKMIKVIGKGSFGKVFLVREIKTGEMFALKVLRKDNIIKRNQVEHTRTERSVLGYVQHPFIVGLNMAFQSKDKLYFVLDYCAGGELFFHLGKLGKFPEPRARFYAAEIVLALQHVHNLDIIYRDLKPENVLLDAQGHVRLTDFGLSKEGITASSSGANSFCGTPEYLAPEILNRQGHGRAVDWWSLGALLYEMLTGLPPFYCQDRERLFEKIQRAELQYPPTLSPSAKQVLTGLLTRDPTTRLGSGPTDAQDVQSQEFFADIQWTLLSKGQVTPPWKPQISGSLDTSQFDREFTSMPMMSPQSYQRPNGFGNNTPVENPFEGFTFTDRIFHGRPTN